MNGGANMKSKIIELGTAAGTIAGRLYGGPLASTVGRAIASSFIPKLPLSNSVISGTRALMWNMNRKAAIEHIGYQAFNWGVTCGPIAGGAIGFGVGLAVGIAADKAINTLMAYREHKNNIQGYDDLNTNNLSPIETIDVDEDAEVIVNHGNRLELVLS